MSRIKNIGDLQEVLLEEIGRFRRGEVDIQHAVALGKLSDSVLGTIKTQFEYSRFLKEVPLIPFMQEAHVKNHMLIDAEPKKVRKLELRTSDD